MPISSSKFYCQFDLVLLITRQITVCLNGQKLIAKNAFRTNSFLIGFGYDSEKLSQIFDEPSASSYPASSSSSSSTLKRFNFGLNNDNNNNNRSDELNFNNNFSHFPPNNGHQRRSVIDFLKKILADLDVFVEKKLKNGVVTSDKNHSVHGVPMWAIVVFVALLAVTFSCVAVSHWINIGQRGRNRFRQRDKTVTGVKSHTHDRRWRAGFAGGVMDMHALMLTNFELKYRQTVEARSFSRDGIDGFLVWLVDAALLVYVCNIIESVYRSNVVPPVRSAIVISVVEH
uniref:Uncharacterized protein n=1 Tax=Romanomermis culicivorax TaxID=13658 RepID=A0A915K6L9_ROMCU